MQAILDSVKSTTSPDLDGFLKVRLGSGVIDGISVRWPGWTGQKNVYNYEYSYRGILFVGDGRSKTIIRDNGLANSGVHVGAGRVAFEGLTLASSYRGGTILRTSVEGGDPVWLTIRDVDIVAEDRVKWGLFLYNTDDYLEDVDFYCAETAEHAYYRHGHAERRSVWKNVRVHNAGAECDKNVSRPEEGCRWFKDQTIERYDCVYSDWHQPHSTQGGGLVVQGASAHVIVDRCIFRPSSRNPSKCLMVDDSFKTWGDGQPYTGARFFDVHTGRPVTPQDVTEQDCANGWVFVTDTAIEGLGTASYTPMVRIGPNVGGTIHKLARGMLLQGSGIYGSGTKVELIGLERLANGAEALALDRCNTPQVEAAMRVLGFEAKEESVLALYGHPWRKVSQGFQPVVS